MKKAPPPKPHSSKGPQSKFINTLHYSNDLPPVPFPPKFLRYPFDPLRYVKYTPTSLEKEYEFPLLTEPDLGIPINLIDPNAYYCPRDILDKGLSAEDKLLLKEHDKPDREEEEQESVPWLKRNEYMTTDFGKEQLFGTPSGKKQSANFGSNILPMEVEAHIEAIEKSFEQAQKPPVHPTKPELKAVEVFDILPGEDLWKYQFMDVIFDANPAPAPPEPNDEDYEDKLIEQEDLCAHGIISAMKTDTGEDYAIFLVPKLVGYMDLDAFEDLDEDEQKEYSFVREYAFNFPSVNDVRSVFFVLDKGKGSGSFNMIHKRVELKKRARTAAGDSIASALPDSITLKTMPLTDDDYVTFDDRVTSLKPVELVEGDDEENEMIDSDSEKSHFDKDIFGGETSDEESE